MLQLDIRSMAGYSVTIERVSCPNDLALSKGPRTVGKALYKMPQKWLEDRYAGADEAGMNLDDAPEESICGYPWTIC